MDHPETFFRTFFLGSNQFYFQKFFIIFTNEEELTQILRVDFPRYPRCRSWVIHRS